MYSERFLKFIKVIHRHEGGLSNNPKDPGGTTNFGISLRFLMEEVGMAGDFDHDGDLDEHDIQAMTMDQAAELYFKFFYQPLKIEQINNEWLALQLFDFGVNAGKVRAVKVLQKVLNLKDDGVIGRLTLAAANDTECGKCGQCFEDSRMLFYKNLVVAKASLAGFLPGWLNRVKDCTI